MISLTPTRQWRHREERKDSFTTFTNSCQICEGTELKKQRVAVSSAPRSSVAEPPSERVPAVGDQEQVASRDHHGGDGTGVQR